jgi:hypothetical protein
MPDAHGPQTSAIEALIERARRLTGGELTALAAAWDVAARDAAVAARIVAWAAARMNASRHAWDAVIAARHAAMTAVRVAARDARYAAWATAGDAAGAAALALAVRDLIPDDAYRTLTGPWAEVIGPAHPNDLTPETPHACLPS